MKNLTLKEYEQFSAYLDGQLSPTDRRRLEEQLNRNPEWRQALDELSVTRAILRSAPKYRAPRNFTISPAQARQYARKAWLPTFISFRFSGAVAALSVAAAILLQLLPAGGMSARVAMAPAAEPNVMLMAPTEAAAAEAESMKAVEAPQAAGTEITTDETAATQPPVILWGAEGGALSSQAIGRGGGGGSGGGNGNDLGEGIVTYDGESAPDQSAPADSYNPSFNLPPQSAETLPEQEQQLQASPAATSPAALEGSGPILGVPSTDTAGQIIAEEPAAGAADAMTFSADTTRQAEAASAAPGFWTTTRIAQAGLLGLALLAAVLAILARRGTP